jgi:bleomycin hydrolase
MTITQEYRQGEFESFATTDDHLMHITGLSKDKDGTKYYDIKNSWGEISDYKGFLYMSDSYFRLKTVGILVHKSAIPKDIATKLAL